MRTEYIEGKWYSLAGVDVDGDGIGNLGKCTLALKQQSVPSADAREIRFGNLSISDQSLRLRD
jgi:hypothetical protein